MTKEASIHRLPLIGFVVKLCTGFVGNQVMHFKRRRSSFRLASFFKLKMSVSIIGLFLFLYFPFRMHTGFGPDDMLGDCIQSTNTVVEGELLKFYTRDPPFVDARSFWTFARYFRKTWQCESSGLGGVSTILDTSCGSSAISSLQVWMFAVASFYALLVIICFLMSFGFKFFSNLPVAELDLDQMTWRVSFLGGLCKHGPWLARAILVIVASLVVGLLIRVGPISTILPSNHGLRGPITALTSRTIAFTTNLSTADKLVCVSYVNKESSRYYFSEYCRGSGLPHQTDTEEHLRQCNSPAYKAMFSGRFDVRVVYPTRCQRCWVLHHDCMDTDVNRIRVVFDAADSNFLYKSSAQFDQTCPYYGIDIPGQKMFRDVYCRCLYVGDATTNEAAAKRLDNKIDSLNLPKIEGAATAVLPCDESISTTTVETCIPPNFRNQQPLSQIVKAENPDDPYAAFRTNASLGYVAEQFCSWGPSNEPSLFFDEPECSQLGSYINRYIYIFCLVMSILTVMLVGIGAMLRFAVSTETWCYNPHADNENYFWKLLRTLGPG